MKQEWQTNLSLCFDAHYQLVDYHAYVGLLPTEISDLLVGKFSLRHATGAVIRLPAAYLASQIGKME